MGQKVHPLGFRVGTSAPHLSSWYTATDSSSHLLSQDLEVRNFLSTLLKRRGILLRSCKISRSPQKLSVDLDLFFSYLLTKQAKFLWARALFRSIKGKYKKINKIRDVKNFVRKVEDEKDSTLEMEDRIGKKAGKKMALAYKSRFFFFLLFKRGKSQIPGKKKEGRKLLSALKKGRKNQSETSALVRLRLRKFSRLFVLQKFAYNFKTYSLKNSLVTRQKSLDFLEISKNLSKSLRDFSGVENLRLRIFSNQLTYLPSFKFYQKRLFKELSRFQRDRELKKYFVESLESFYFVVRSFGFGNASLLSQILVFLLENSRKQIFVVKFLKKSLNLLFQTISKNEIAVDGVKILIKGRFNKRRRTKKVVLQEGLITLQTISTPIDYCQSQAITIYGSFGIKVWISKRSL